MQAADVGPPGGDTTILSIDGGGIRGVIPAVVLSEIEKRTDRRIHELFDVIAGTSTGGILALGLACPGPDGGALYRASDLLQMYESEGPKIFPYEFLGKIAQLFGPKYPERGRRAVLEKRFQGARLSQALTEVIVTAYDIQAREPVFFRKVAAEEDPTTHDFPMLDVALATSAAPTYFRPVKLGAMVLVDGGVFANDPGMCGFVDKTTAQGQRQGTMVVSLGTGRLTKSLPYIRAKRWGLIGWGLHVLNVVFDGVTEAVDYELKQILGPDYHRFQTELTEAQEPMDDASRANVSALKALAVALVQDESNSKRLDEVCQQLVARRSNRPPRSGPSS